MIRELLGHCSKYTDYAKRSSPFPNSFLLLSFAPSTPLGFGHSAKSVSGNHCQFPSWLLILESCLRSPQLTPRHVPVASGSVYRIMIIERSVAIVKR
jgi:hypothetical protein